VRLSEILARFDYLNFRKRWIERGPLGMVPPPPESDLSYPPSTSSTNNRFANGYVDASTSEWVRFTDGTNNELDISLNQATSPLAANRPWISFNKTTGALYIDAANGNGINIGSNGGTTAVFLGAALRTSSGCTKWNNISTASGTLGIAAVFGADFRLAVASVDGSAITVYTTTGSGQVYRLMARVFGSAGTVSAASYVIVWTEAGATVTKTLSISAVDTDADLSILIQPDTGTAITAQLTVLTGTGSPKVNVACSVEELK
jgi:hypothetical protein